MKKMLIPILLLVSFLSSAQTELNEELKTELRKIDDDDQNLRKLYFVKKTYESKLDSLKTQYNTNDIGVKKILVDNMRENDSLNIIKIEGIIDKYGYPGKSLVGQKESGVAWAVIHHSTPEILNKYLDTIKKAADNGEIEFTKYALSLDRVLMYNNKPQIYGSQAKDVKLVGSKERKLIIWPIENPKKVHELRKKAGFYESLRKYAKNLGIKYKVYLMEDIVSE